MPYPGGAKLRQHKLPRIVQYTLEAIPNQKNEAQWRHPLLKLKNGESNRPGGDFRYRPAVTYRDPGGLSICRLIPEVGLRPNEIAGRQERRVPPADDALGVSITIERWNR